MKTLTILHTNDTHGLRRHHLRPAGTPFHWIEAFPKGQ